MNKKRAVKLGIIIGIIVLLGIIGMVGVKKMTEQTEKDRQISFLKEHEEEIIKDAFEIDNKMTADNISFDWNTVKIEKAGVIIAKPYGLSVKISYTNKATKKEFENRVTIKTDVEKLKTYEFEGFD